VIKNRLQKVRSKKPNQITKRFAGEFFPARPKELLAKAGRKAKTRIALVRRLGRPTGKNKRYVKWLESTSMLNDAQRLAQKYVGQGVMWRNPYAKPRPRSAIAKASVWYTAYPMSMVTRPNESIVTSLADPQLWSAFQQIGIEALHTGPMKLAGGLDGWKLSPSIDGHFDRISTNIDPLFGTDDDFRRLTAVAMHYGGLVIDDIVPGHTGKGADFWLAAMAHSIYPGIYHMVQINREDWPILPAVPKGRDSVNLHRETEDELKKRGYIVGRLQRVIFYEPGVKETNWSVTRPIRGVDGVDRRWVYLHYFKEGQPSVNWLDPTFAGMRLVIGDALHSLGELHTKGLRLDANGFLGVEKVSETGPAWSEGHPLSEAANHFIASLVRKLGGFTFQELNLTLEDLKVMSQSGADLSYDFINRPAYHHALATADTEFLKMSLRLAHEYGIDPASLVHALQNHDDLTYELVHFWTGHKDDIYHFRGKDITGLELRELIRSELADKLTGPHASYNMLFTENGIACTTTSAIAAIIGVKDLHTISDEERETIKMAHLLLAKFNAWQPGVFALSGWDLSGALTLAGEQVAELIKDGDTRWINRGAYDLLGSNSEVQASSTGMPLAASLYGTLPEQLQRPDSFASQLKEIIELRNEHNIATAHQLEIPETTSKSVLVMVHRLPREDLIQLTILNFSNQPVSENIVSQHFTSKASVIDLLTHEYIGDVTGANSIKVDLSPYQGVALLIRP
jgi:trehalose synthase